MALRPNYPASIRSRQGVTDVLEKCLYADIYDRMRKTKTFCNACMSYGLTWTLAWMKKFVFFFAWKEAYFASAT